MNWAITLAKGVPWQVAYAAVETQAKMVLDTLAPEETLTTAALHARIWGSESTDTLAHKRLFKALAALADFGLAHYVTLGAPEPSKFNGTMRRKTWHAAFDPDDMGPDEDAPLTAEQLAHAEEQRTKLALAVKAGFNSVEEWETSQPSVNT